MPIIKVKKNDLDKFRPVENLGWKLLQCLDISDGKASKNGDSINYWAKFKVIAPNDSDKGLEFDHCCNTNAGFSVEPLICAANGLTRAELFGDKEEVDLNLDTLPGKIVEGNLGHRTDDNNRVNNDVKEWAPAGTHFPEATWSAPISDQLPLYHRKARRGSNHLLHKLAVLLRIPR